MRRLLIFHSYSEASGQLVNNAKSRFFAGSMSQSRRLIIAGMLGFSSGGINFQYLGCPIFKGKSRCIHFQAITDRIKVKLATSIARPLDYPGKPMEIAMDDQISSLPDEVN